MGLGVRIGVYLQIAALLVAVCCGQSDTLSAIPAAIMTALTLNIVLSMKATTHIFKSNPVVQDFWITQCQLFLLVTLLPYMFLFGHWHHRILGLTKCALFLLTIVYTYVQTVWFWTSGYKNSDELVCGVVESSVFRNTPMFTHHGYYAILALYGVGFLILLVMLPNFIRGRTGFFSPLIQKVSKKYDWGKAVALGLVSVPLVAFVLLMVEQTVRRGSQDEWMGVTGQWLALGVGFFTAAEAVWHALRNTYREILGGAFSENNHFLGGGGKQDMKQPRAGKDLASASPLQDSVAT